MLGLCTEDAALDSILCYLMLYVGFYLYCGLLHVCVMESLNCLGLLVILVCYDIVMDFQSVAVIELGSVGP
jgi:hypothetical protein